MAHDADGIHRSLAPKCRADEDTPVVAEDGIAGRGEELKKSSMSHTLCLETFPAKTREEVAIQEEPVEDNCRGAQPSQEPRGHKIGRLQ